MAADLIFCFLFWTLAEPTSVQDDVFAAPLHAEPMQQSRAASEDSPNLVLLRSIESRQPVPRTLVQSQMKGDSTDCRIQVKLQVDKNGRTRRTVLQPISMQGIVIFDDGRNWVTFHPDDNTAVFQPAPTGFRMDPRRRLQLIERNYELSFGRQETVAGRRVYVVNARPRNTDMETRRYSIDRETYVLLRLELIGPGSKTRVAMDTLAASFEAPNGGEPLRMPALEGVSVVQAPSPSPTLRVRGEMWGRLGFSPRVPENLPYGFRVVGSSMLGDENRPMLAIRMTDGLITAIAYQWDARRAQSNKMPEGRSVRTADGVSILVVGDLPREIRTRLTEAFRAPSATRSPSRRDR